MQTMNRATDYMDEFRQNKMSVALAGFRASTEQNKDSVSVHSAFLTCKRLLKSVAGTQQCLFIPFFKEQNNNLGNFID